MIVAKPDANLLVASTGGYGFITKFGDLLAKKRGGKEFMTLEPGEEPLPPFQFQEAPANYVAALVGAGAAAAILDRRDARALEGPRRHNHGIGKG